MLELNGSTDNAVFDRDIDLAIFEQVIPTVADTLNEMAVVTRDAVRDAMREGFDRPKPFTLKGVRVLPA